MLTQAQVDFYREHGYVVVKGMFTPEEAARFRAESHALIERLQRIGNGVDQDGDIGQPLAGATFDIGDQRLQLIQNQAGDTFQRQVNGGCDAP